VESTGKSPAPNIRLTTALHDDELVLFEFLARHKELDSILRPV
jgi:hypothetical protein